VTVRVISVELEPGGPMVLAEVTGEEFVGGDAYTRAANPAEALAAGARSVREAIDSLVVPSARLFKDSLSALKPTTVEVCFGLRISGYAGVLFASSSSEGSITVKLTWTDVPPAESEENSTP
jgi:hypothetical protein